MDLPLRHALNTCAFLTLVGCGDAKDVSFRGDPNDALVLTTDFLTGSYTTVGAANRVNASLGLVHSDAVCRYLSELGQFAVVNRFGADSLLTIDPDNAWRVDSEYSVGSGSNPQDVVALGGGLVAISRYASPNLAIMDVASGRTVQEIPLDAFSDDDGQPEMAWMHREQDALFVSLQRLSNFAPTDFSSIAMIDLTDFSVQQVIRLTGSNPFAPLRRHPTEPSLVVSTSGLFGTLDGGLEFFDLASQTLSGWVLSESDLGGDIIDIVMRDHDEGFALIGVPNTPTSTATEVVRFSLSSRSVTQSILTSDAFTYASMTLNRETDTLWVADRSFSRPGLWLVDADTGLTLNAEALSVGLPPFMTCFR